MGAITGAVAALIIPAAAADLPVKAPPPPVATWDGVYLGGSIGWEKSDTNWTTTCFTATGLCPDTQVWTFPPVGSSPHNFSMSGARYGGFFGVNWQVLPAWVVGVEADAAWSTNRLSFGLIGCTTFCMTFIGGNPAGDTTSVGTTWDGSMRARAGYLATSKCSFMGRPVLRLKRVPPL